jgi:signal transduction histidine kinase
MEAVGRLAGAVAHDFNNLLTAMLMQLSSATTKFPADHPVKSHIQRTIKAAERATELTRQMLNYTGRSQAETKPLDINDLTVSVMHFIADPSNEVSIGTAQNEVANPRWVPIDQVRSGSLQVRQGVQEVISAMGSNRLKSDTVLKTTPRFTKKKSSDPRS